MNNLFNNMLSYETILAIMGMIFFLVLVFALVWSVLKKRNITKLLPFFIIPIIMVAYPTLKSIKIGDFILDIQAQSKIVENNPRDTAAVKRLEESLEKLKTNDRLSNNSNVLVAAANAQMILGNYNSASSNLDMARQIDPKTAGLSPLRTELNQKIEINNLFLNNVDKLKKQIASLKTSPGDTTSLNQLNKTLSEIKIPRYVKPDGVLTIAKAYAIAGDGKQSLKIIDNLDASGKSEKSLAPLKDSIANQTFQKQFFSRATDLNAIRSAPPLSNKELFDKSVIRKIPNKINER
jgi:tetratricopeptide (TPR) repeat protein